MIRLSRLADYGIVLLSYFVRDGDGAMHTARSLADASGLPLPTVSKVLKGLGRGGLLVSHRGVNGGYVLSRAPDNISVVEIIRSIDGPIALTECSGVSANGPCDLEAACPVRANWQKINSVVTHALSHLTLTSMTVPPRPTGSQPAGAGASLRVVGGN